MVYVFSFKGTSSVYCSATTVMPPSYSDIDRSIIELTRARGRDKSVCPSEVARALFSTDWRAAMEDVRQRARHLAASGHIDVTQGGFAVDPAADWRGPIRLRWRGEA